VDDISIRLPREIVKRIKLLAVERDTIKKPIVDILLKALEEEYAKSLLATKVQT